MPRTTSTMLPSALIAIAVIALTPEASLAGDDSIARYVIPVPLAPVSLQGTFPVHATLAASSLDGTLTLALDGKGALAGTMELNAATFAVTGKQGFKSGRGSVALAAVGTTGRLTLKGKLQASAFTGTIKGAGAGASGSGTFGLDTSLAAALVAQMSLGLGSDAQGALTGTGSARIAGADVALSASGKSGKKFALTAKGTGFQWSGKGVPSAGGWLISTKAAGYGAVAAETGIQISAIAVDLGAGVVAFAGSYPAYSRVTSTSGSFTGPLDAYTGQAIVFFDPAVTPAAAQASIQANGGTIVSAVPSAGYHLVGVAPGTEETFIAAMSGGLGVVHAGPHVRTEYMGVNTVVIDDCTGSHGKMVIGSFVDSGGTQFSCISDDDGTGTDHPVLDLTMRNLLFKIGQGGNQPTLVNVSTNGGFNSGHYPDVSTELQAEMQRLWKATMEVYLLGIAALTEQQRENLVVTICAGNDDMPLAAMLAELRADPRLRDVLARNVLLVGATEAAYDGSNYAADDDPDFARMTDSAAPGGTKGTSFAAPRALAILQKIILLKNLTARQALDVAKRAVKANASRSLIESEALLLADQVVGFAPVIDVQPRTLAFSYRDGDMSGPAQQVVTISNTGNASSVLRYTITASGSFIRLSPPSYAGLPGGKEVSFGVSASTDMKPGTYRGTVTVSDPKASNRSVSVAVTLTILPKQAGKPFDGTYTGTFSGELVCTVADQTFRSPVSGPVSFTFQNGVAVGSALSGSIDTNGSGSVVIPVPGFSSVVFTGVFTSDGHASGNWTAPAPTDCTYGGGWNAAR